MEGFLHYDCGGLIFGGAYFLNFMVTPNQSIINYNQKNLFIRMPYFCNFVQVRVHVYFFIQMC